MVPLRSSIIKHFLLKTLLLLFLGTSYLTATHIHHDDLDHEEGCEVCVMVNNFHSADIPHATIDIASVEWYFDDIVLYENYPVKHTPKGFYSTAPPSY